MTAEREPSAPARQGQWDQLIAHLHALRAEAGNPSFAELSRRLVDQRMRDGMDVHGARIARSSVHDAFRFGRTRINVLLTQELVRALGGDPDQVLAWMQERTAADEVASGPPPAAAQPPAGSPEPKAVEEPRARQVLLLAVACLVLNLAGREFVDFLRLPIYLDMVGTAIAAIALGPWHGAAVGVTTNVGGAVGSGWVSIPFALVSVVGALVWGYGVRRWRLGRTLPRFFGLNVLAAVACSAVAVPIIVLLFGHDLRIGHDVITGLVDETVSAFLAAVMFSNMLTSLTDKLLSGFIALVAVSALPASLRQGLTLVAVTEPRTDP